MAVDFSNVIRTDVRQPMLFGNSLELFERLARNSFRSLPILLKEAVLRRPVNLREISIPFPLRNPSIYPHVVPNSSRAGSF